MLCPYDGKQINCLSLPTSLPIALSMLLYYDDLKTTVRNTSHSTKTRMVAVDLDAELVKFDILERKFAKYVCKN